MSNLVKIWNMNIESEDKYVIDSNSLAQRRIEEERAKRSRKSPAVSSEEFQPGFVSGLDAEDVDVDALLADGEMQLDENGNIIHSGGGYVSEDEPATDPSQMLDMANEEADQIIASANEQAAQILENARAEAEEIRAAAAQEGKNAGYEEGMRQAEMENAGTRRELENEKVQLEGYYQEQLDEMESKLVDTITDLYEQIFRSDLSKEKEILVHLIGNTLQKVESGTTYLVHVSRENYEMVSSRKEMLQGMVASSSCNLEIVEDISLTGEDCIIETDGGIFDCGLGTELKELAARLKLLSYNRN